MMYSFDDLIDVLDIQPEHILDDFDLMVEFSLCEEYALYEEFVIEGLGIYE